jgi:glucokinase
MSATQHVFLGTDCGATTSKVAGVWADGSPVSTELLQRSTNAQLGPEVVVQSWVEANTAYLEQNGLSWDAVRGVGVAIPGPRRSYGVLERGPNLPESFVGFDVYTAYRQALEERAGREIPLAVGNDGNMGGVAEAQRVRGGTRSSVLMLAPGSGLGCAYIDSNGLPLDGDTLAGMEGSHMPAPLHLLGVDAWPCGCGRTWGCVEMYTSLAGLPRLLERALAAQPDHELARSPLPLKERAFALRGLAQDGDALATGIFDFQAKAMGLFVAMLAMALDPEFVVIGGGLMDPDATTEAFRDRYLRVLRETADPFLWTAQRQKLTVVPAALGDLSQAIGAALVALYQRPATVTAG